MAMLRVCRYILPSCSGQSRRENKGISKDILFNVLAINQNAILFVFFLGLVRAFLLSHHSSIAFGVFYFPLQQLAERGLCWQAIAPLVQSFFKFVTVLFLSFTKSKN